MSRSWINLLFLVLLCSFVSANFTANMVATADGTDEIYSDEIAYFNLSITNNADISDSFIIYTLDPSWMVSAEGSNLKVPAKSTREFDVRVDPTSAVKKSAQYKVGFEVKSYETNVVVSIVNDILIKSEAGRTFSPSITINAEVGDSESAVYSTDGIPMKIRFVNNNGLNVTNAIVELYSLNSNYIPTNSFNISIAPNGQVIKNLQYDLDPYTAPSNDELVVIQVRVGGRVVSEKRIPFTIQQNKFFFKRDVVQNSAFLYSTYNVTLTNLNNVETTEVFEYPLTSLQKTFTKYTPAGVDGEKGITFSVKLKPAESAVIHVETDYRRTFYTSVTLFGAFVILMILYLIFRSPVIVKKEAVVVGEKDGGTSEVKVLVHVKNRSRHVIENIAILDRIPGLTEIEQEFSLGTLKPRKIVRNPRKGTFILWDFPTMEPFEERIITYRIHSRVGILGHLSLPRAVVKFMTPDGRTRTYRSPKKHKH